MDARVPKVERIDLIGVDNFLCVLNNLKIGITWSSCLEEFKSKSHARSLIYSKYLIRWHGRIQYLKANSRSSFSQWRRMMRNKIVFIYLLIIVFYNFIVSCCFLLIRILLGVFIQLGVLFLNFSSYQIRFQQLSNRVSFGLFKGCFIVMEKNRL